MLGLIREYALARLDKSADARRIRHEHASYFAGLVEAEPPRKRGEPNGAWLDHLEIEHENNGPGANRPHKTQTRRYTGGAVEDDNLVYRPAKLDERQSGRFHRPGYACLGKAAL